MAPCVYLIHNSAEIYEDPGSFIPERFLERRAAVPTWIPFGGGARRCLAASYAEQEMKRVVRTVLEEVELKPVESRSERVTQGGDRLQPRPARPRRRQAPDPRLRMSSDYDLIVVGAGAKAAGIATKVHILNSLGLAQLSILVIEGTEVAASWKGRNGMTSGEEPLAVTPIKDVGFPYQSHVEFGEAGEAIDASLAQFTWQQHMISKRRYARWVDAGSPPVRHRDYGEYLTWVLSRATEGVEHLSARVTQVTLERRSAGWSRPRGRRASPGTPAAPWC